MPGSNREDIGARIKLLRDNAEMKQEDLAKVVSLSNRESIAMWETGKREVKTEYVVKLADHFNVSCDYILRGVEAENIDVHRQLGLSEQVIETLKTYVQERKNGNYDDAINGLNAVFDTETPYKFFQNIHCYMARVIDEPLVIDGGIDTDVKAGMFTFGEYSFAPDMLDKCFLLALQEYLMQARERGRK